MSKVLLLPIGIPGIGKSYYCKNFLAPYGIKSISSDAIRGELYGNESIQGNPAEIFNIVFDRARKVMSKNGAVCIDATNCSRYARRQAIFNLCPDRTIYIIMDNDIELAKKQNKMRKRYCPERVMYDMARKLKNEPPQEDGFYGVEIYKWNDLSLLDVLKEITNG